MNKIAPALCRTVAAFAAAATIASLPSSAFAAKYEHTKEDIAKHQQIAKAHDAAAQCVAAGKSSSDCDEQLKAACKGIAVGEHCGLRTKSAAYKDSAKHAADHGTMVSAHSNVAACLAAGKPHADCSKALAQDCSGVGVGKYCGMRHTH